MQLHIRVAAFQLFEQRFIPRHVKFRVQSTLQQQLVASESQHLLDFAGILLYCGYEYLVALRWGTVKVAESTTRNAAICDIDISVDLPSHDWFGVQFHTAGMCSLHQPSQWSRVPQLASLFNRDALSRLGLFQYIFNNHRCV